MQAAFAALFERDLNRVIKEIKSYNDENDMWKISEGISNSAGNLVLHLIGNLNHFFGATLSDTGYIRDRDKEFSDKNVSRGKLIDNINDTISMIKNTLEKISNDDLEKDFPVAINNTISSTGFILIHLSGHLNYHLGQINYHRRMSKGLLWR